MRTKLTSLFLASLLLLTAIPVWAGSLTLYDVTVITPNTYSACVNETTSDVITIQGLTSTGYRLKGWVRVEYVTDAGRVLVPGGEYFVDTTTDMTLQVFYPPVSQWPVQSNGTAEIHVDLALELLDWGGYYLPDPRTFGPGQNWDVFCLVPPSPPPPPPPPPGPGTGTPGYWKNHPEAWPVESITIGEDTYSKDQAIALMNMGDGDKTWTLFRAYVSAYLNTRIGNESSCIMDTLSAAHAWLDTYEPSSGVKGGGPNSPWRVGEPLYLTLDNYNNGLLCAPHRD